ncbi:hypothetical protein OG937_01455 [Streptomyces sp. NBC_00510]
MVTGTYSRTPDGTVLGTLTGTTRQLAITDQHTDLVAALDATGTTVTGSTAYDPFGKDLHHRHHVGYQSDWTDPATGNVNMAARWYQPGTGTFPSRDNWTLDPTPSIQANRYLYGNGEPLNGTDSTGHAFDPRGGAGPGAGRGGGRGGAAGGGSTAKGGSRGIGKNQAKPKNKPKIKTRTSTRSQNHDMCNSRCLRSSTNSRGRTTTTARGTTTRCTSGCSTGRQRTDQQIKAREAGRAPIRSLGHRNRLCSRTPRDQSKPKPRLHALLPSPRSTSARLTRPREPKPWTSAGSMI